MGYKDREVQREYQRAWYRNQSKKYRRRMRSLTKQHKKHVHDWYQSYKRTLRCKRCPERHPACLQFHHREAKEKSFTISLAARSGIRIERILEEIAKCDVLCANCHMKLHWQDGEIGREV